jgi:hypothetical protein
VATSQRELHASGQDVTDAAFRALAARGKHDPSYQELADELAVQATAETGYGRQQPAPAAVLAHHQGAIQTMLAKATLRKRGQEDTAENLLEALVECEELAGQIVRGEVELPDAEKTVSASDGYRVSAIDMASVDMKRETGRVV